MAGQRLVFDSGLESLFSKNIRARVTPQVRSQLEALGVYIDKRFLPAYPVETWGAMLEVLAKELYPLEEREQAHLLLGRETIEGFAHTVIGKAAFTMMKLLGIVRSVERASRSYASTNNYTQVKLIRVGPTAFDFHLNETHTLPQYDMGVVEGVLRTIGAKDPKVTLLSKDAEGFTMHLEWK